MDESYWSRAIEAAEERGKFSVEEIEEAFDWDTCAVGKCFERLSHASESEKQPGRDFYDAVRNHDFKRAATIHERIQCEADYYYYD